MHSSSYPHFSACSPNVLLKVKLGGPLLSKWSRHDLLHGTAHKAAQRWELLIRIVGYKPWISLSACRTVSFRFGCWGFFPPRLPKQTWKQKQTTEKKISITQCHSPLQQLQESSVLTHFFPVLPQPYSWVVKALPDTAVLHLLCLGRETKPLPGSLFWPLVIHPHLKKDYKCVAGSRQMIPSMYFYKYSHYIAQIRACSA